MEWLLDLLTNLSSTAVYLALIGILLLCGLGLPIPEDISLISAGYLAYVGLVNVHTAFVVCLIAVLTGDIIAFGLGHFFGSKLLATRWAQKHFSQRKQLRVRAYFRKFGSKVIFVARFLPGVRFSIFFSAGCMHLRPSVFFVYDSLAALLSVPALVYLAWIFGEHIDHVLSWVRRSEYGILAISIALGTFIAFKIWKTRRAHALARERLTPPPERVRARVETTPPSEQHSKP